MSTPEVQVWVDGALVYAREARISPFDHGLLVGDGVFETLRVYGGVPFAWRRWPSIHHPHRAQQQRLAAGVRAGDRAHRNPRRGLLRAQPQNRRALLHRRDARRRIVHFVPVGELEPIIGLGRIA